MLWRTEVIGYVATRSTSDVTGMGASERAWAVTKKIKSSQRTKLGSDKVEKISIISTKIQMLEKVAGDPKLCREKMELALAAVEGDSTRRALLGGQEERHLAICGGACVVLVVVFLLGFSTNAY